MEVGAIGIKKPTFTLLYLSIKTFAIEPYWFEITAMIGRYYVYCSEDKHFYVSLHIPCLSETLAGIICTLCQYNTSNYA